MSDVRLLKPEELGLTEKIQKFEDALRTEAKSGSYEWWYFDSKYPDDKRKKFNVYAKTRDECEKLLAEMIEKKKAEITEMKKKAKKA